MRLDLERHRPAVRESEHAGVLARPLDDLRTGRGKGLQDRPGMLVGAVLTPQRREDAQLGEGGCAAQHRLDAAVFCWGEIVLAHELRRDGRVAPAGRRPGHESEARAPETPRITARNTRPKMVGSGCFTRASASAASSHSPWQWVHWSIWMPCQSPVRRS